MKVYNKWVYEVEKDELDLISPICASFLANEASMVGFDEDHFLEACPPLMDSGALHFLITLSDEGDVKGIIGFMIYTNLFCTKKYGSEIGWYVSPEFRGGRDALRLLDAFEGFTKDQGCDEIIMVHLKDATPEKLRNLYLRRGYKETETNYLKKI